MQQPIGLVVLDLAGTSIDHGCQAPISAFVQAFAERGVEVSIAEARGPMGMHKRDHIRCLFELESVASQWRDEHGRAWSEDDVEEIFNSFLPRQQEIAMQHIDLIAGGVETLAELREQGIAVATTTGYPRAVAAPVLEAVAAQGFVPDFSVCADEVPAGRPAPWMIFKCMERLDVFPPARVVKVGDTVPDVQAGRNAGVWSVGVTESGSEFGLTVDELAGLADAERREKHEQVSDKLTLAGAHEVTTSIARLPALIADNWG